MPILERLYPSLVVTRHGHRVTFRSCTSQDLEFARAIARAALRVVARACDAGTAIVRDETGWRRRLVEQLHGAPHSVLEVERVAAGLVTFEPAPEAIQLRSLLLMPAFRDIGVGTAVLARLKREARRDGVPLRWCLAAGSPASQWAQRRGMAVTHESAGRCCLEYLG
jgi:GNAT superfamily N-acetyltransferase